MTPTPPSTNSSTGGRSPEEQFRVVRKRNRVPLSCYPCRTRKKCDRNHPCSNCMKRDGSDPSTCSYATPASRKKSQSQVESSPDDMQNRIDRLEGLVLSLMHGGGNVDAATAAAAGAAASNPKPADVRCQGSQSVTDSGSSSRMDREGPIMADDDDESDVEDSLANSLGVLKVDSDKGKAMYIGQEHWHTLLADISEVKNYFIYHKKELETSYERVKKSRPVAAQDGPTLLMSVVPASEAELRSGLPPKSTVLALCGRYFNSMDNAVNIIHGPTFQQQLRAHWQNPEQTPLMWLGLLYSILCLATLSYHKVGDEPPEWKGRSLDMSAEYRQRTCQCLVAVDYTKPVDYTIETLMLYVLGEYTSRWDADLPLWLIVSLIIRIALRQGYHRDAKWFPTLTPFQAEMRRRIWALVRMSDVFFSNAVSLPSMIDQRNCDTQLPNNLFDDELYPEMKEAPVPRPSTEPTPIAYMIAKARLGNELGSILHATTDLGTHVPYDEIIRHDARLRQIMQELPPHLKLGSEWGSQDPVTLLVARYNIDILYQKIMCLLHRKYLPRARQYPRYAHSRRSAIEASLTALDHLAALQRESQPDGKLRSVRWFVKSIATKDFVMPAVLTLLDLHFDNVSLETSLPSDGEGNFLWSPEQRSRMIRALESAQAIWRGMADTSMEAFKAAKVIEIMLEKTRNPSMAAAMPRTGGSSSEASRNEPMSTIPSSLGLGPSPDMSQNSASPGNLNFADWNPNANPFSPSNANAFMGMDLGVPSTTSADVPLGSLAMGAGASPFSMLGTNGAGMPDLTANFDWSMLENYAQTANFGPDQSFQIYGFEGEQQNGDAIPPTTDTMDM